MASSTHPFARCKEQTRVHNERYDGLVSDLRALTDRMLICGMHVHAAIEDEELRIDLMNQATYFLPHLLARCPHRRRSGRATIPDSGLSADLLRRPAAHRLARIFFECRGLARNARPAWRQPVFARIRARSGGISDRAAVFPRSRCASATSARRWRTRSRSLRFIRRSWPRCSVRARKIRAGANTARS